MPWTKQGVFMAINSQAAQTENATKKVYDPLPEGDYVVKLDRVFEKPTNAGDGTLVKANFRVETGEHVGRLIFEQFLINHPNAQAATIGKEQLSKMLTAMGVVGGFEGLGNDASQIEGFVGQTLLANVGIEISKNPKYKDRNKIKKWVKIS